MDRLDYLARDSFFTGVAEGVVGIDRIIKMLEIHDDRLVVEAKGVYSIEKFLIARRLMYWQVYLHKTVLAADAQLIDLLLRRATWFCYSGDEPCRLTLRCWYSSEDGLLLRKIYIKRILVEGRGLLDHFVSLDDTDILSAIKMWQYHPDFHPVVFGKRTDKQKIYYGTQNQTANALSQFFQSLHNGRFVHGLTLTIDGCRVFS
jgi:uncharacterized protein